MSSFGRNGKLEIVTETRLWKHSQFFPEQARNAPVEEDGPAAKRPKESGSEVTEREVVIEEGPIVPDLVTPDEHLDDDDLDEDEDEDILSASQLLRRHRADEFEEEEYEEDYYWDRIHPDH